MTEGFEQALERNVDREKKTVGLFFGEKIIVEAEKDKEAAAKFLEKMHKEGGEEFIPYEAPKTPRDERIIEERTWAVDGFIKFFGGKPRKIEKERIHLLKPGSVEDYSGGDMKDAFCDALSNCLSVDRYASDVATAVNIQHELFHLESPKIFQWLNGTMRLRRLGLRTFEPPGKSRLTGLDEALIAEVNYQLFDKNIKNNPLYREELKIVEEIKPWVRKYLEKWGLDKIRQEIYLSDIYTVIGAEKLLKFLESDKSEGEKMDYLAEIIKNPRRDCKLMKFERFDEWINFSRLADEIITKSNGEVRNVWEVIDMFARVQFAPNDKFAKKLEDLKINIERILGEGAFEKIEKTFGGDD